MYRSKENQLQRQGTFDPYDFDVDSDIEESYIASLRDTPSKSTATQDDPKTENRVTYDPVLSLQEERELNDHMNYVIMMSMFYFEMPPKFYEKINRSRSLIEILPHFNLEKKHLAERMFFKENFGNGMNGDMKVSKVWPKQIREIREDLKRKEEEEKEEQEKKN
eukprot:TCONS_00001743-protein